MASQGKGGKLKGSGFERKVAKLLTDWWNKGGLEGEFYRTPASGGLRWVNRGDTIGDICTPEGFSCTIECKNTESWKYSELFTKTIARTPPLIKQGKNKGKPNSPRTIGEFWFQACEEAKRAGKIPILIFTKNYQKDLLIFSQGSDWYFQYRREFRQWAVDTFFTFEECYSEHSKVIIIRLDKFLEMTEPEMFLEKD